MKRSASVKFSNSVNLFKFCYKVMCDQTQKKVHDQEVGNLLDFNPSDCSHWKRGEKNIKSVFALNRIADSLKVEVTLLHDIASGSMGLEEALFEHRQSSILSQNNHVINNLNQQDYAACIKKVDTFVASIHAQAEFTTAPLYLPEIFRFFPFVSTQPIEMMERLSRILRVKSGQYLIQFCKSDLKPQTRMNIVVDLARIIFQGERNRFEELGALNNETLALEEMAFAAELLAPKKLITKEMAKLDNRINIVSEIAGVFWVPKFLIGFQMQSQVKLFKQSQETQTISSNVQSENVEQTY